MERSGGHCATLSRQSGRSLLVVMFVATFMAVSGILLFAAPVSAALISTPDSGTVQTNGRVWSILVLGDRIYLGGEFTTVNGVPRSR
jgi:hypothetical protein